MYVLMVVAFAVDRVAAVVMSVAAASDLQLKMGGSIAGVAALLAAAVAVMLVINRNVLEVK